MSLKLVLPCAFKQLNFLFGNVDMHRVLPVVSQICEGVCVLSRSWPSSHKLDGK